MQEAAREETDKDVACSDVKDGIPILTVKADCCWSKKSTEPTILLHRVSQILCKTMDTKLVNCYTCMYNRSIDDRCH